MTTRNGRKAVYVTAEEALRLVLLDISLSDMGGFEIVRAIREIPCLRGAVFVAQSGRDDSKGWAKALASGFDRYLVKPIAFEQIESLISAIDENYVGS